MIKNSLGVANEKHSRGICVMTTSIEVLLN